MIAKGKVVKGGKFVKTKIEPTKNLETSNVFVRTKGFCSPLKRIGIIQTWPGKTTWLLGSQESDHYLLQGIYGQFPNLTSHVGHPTQVKVLMSQWVRPDTCLSKITVKTEVDPDTETHSTERRVSESKE